MALHRHHKSSKGLSGGSMNKSKPFSFSVKVDAREILPTDWNQQMIDYANYFQHRIIEGRSLWQLDDETESYTLLKAVYLRTVINDRSLLKVKRALIDNGVIECDGRFIKGSKSYGYRFTEHYRMKPTNRIICKSTAVSSKIRANKREEYRSYTKVHKYLFKWLRKVTFGLNWSEILKVVNGLEIQPGEVLSADEVRELTIDACALLYDGDVTLKQCHYGRVHTNVTRLLTAIRGLLMIDDEKLINVDIANSQPLILGLVIAKDIRHLQPQSGPVTSTEAQPTTDWPVTSTEAQPTTDWPTTDWTETNTQQTDSNQPTNPSQTPLHSTAHTYMMSKSPFCESQVAEDESTYDDSKSDKNDFSETNTQPTNPSQTPPHSTSHTYMMSKSPFCESQVADEEGTYDDSKSDKNGLSEDYEMDLTDRDVPNDLYDLDEYMGLCESGELYDNLMDRLDYHRSRKEFKSSLWFPFLYGQHQIKSPLHDLFASDFPNVWNWILSHKKTHGYEELSRQMQRVESQLMIETVCCRLMEDHPEIPCVTIHDSIMTTPRHIETVKAVIMDVFRDFGLKPTLKS
jgi:hypothetical protein